jgi:serine/threonine-protein kinase RsbW
VRDEGEGFDAAQVADPLSPENILKPSGRGIFIIRHLMDEVQIERRPNGGTEICMTKRL